MGVQSCGKDNEEDGPSQNEIIGTWKLTEVSTDGGVSFSSWTLKETSATFNANGSYSGNGYFGNGNGTWKQKGNFITTYVDGEEYIKYEVKLLSSRTCTLVMSQTGSTSTIWIRCVRTDSSVSDSEKISKDELENAVSFVYDDGGNKTYIKFRDGHIYTKEILKDGMVCNEDDIVYSLVGNNITMDMGYQHAEGKIYKITTSNGKFDIVMEFDGTYGIAKWLSKTFNQSTYQF